MKNTTDKFHKMYLYQIPDRAKTDERPCEAEARPSQLKKTASRPPRAEADASRTSSLDSTELRQRCDHSTTYVTTLGLPVCGLLQRNVGRVFISSTWAV